MLKAVSAVCAAGLSLALGVSAQAAEARTQLTLFTAFDVVRIEAGEDPRENGFNGYDAAGTALNRTYVNVGFTERLDDKYLVSVGVGGIFWRAFAASSSTPDDKVIRFGPGISNARSEEHTSELQSRENLVCRLLLEKKKTDIQKHKARE